MTLIREYRIRSRHIVAPVLAIVVLGYMGYHLVNGDRGLIAWRALDARVEDLRARAASLEAERQGTEATVGLLDPNSLDPDMLDEWSRRLLNFGRTNEIVIFLEGDDAPPARDAPEPEKPTAAR